MRIVENKHLLFFHFSHLEELTEELQIESEVIFFCRKQDF